MNNVDIVKKAIEESPHNMANAAKLAGLPFGTFKYHAVKCGMYRPNQGQKGIGNSHKGKQAFDLEDILSGEVDYKAPSSRLKQRLLKDGYLENRCCLCGQDDSWNGKQLTLQLDHIDGDRYNNKLENLRILCPNCHTQTPTFSKKKNTTKHTPLSKVSNRDIINAITQFPQLHFKGLAQHLNLNPNSASVLAKLKKIKDKTPA